MMTDMHIKRIEYKHDDPCLIGYPFKLIIYSKCDEVYVYSWSVTGDTCLFVENGDKLAFHKDVQVSITTSDGGVQILTDMIKPIDPRTYTVFGADSTVWFICNALVAAVRQDMAYAKKQLEGSDYEILAEDRRG